MYTSGRFFMHAVRFLPSRCRSSNSAPSQAFPPFLGLSHLLLFSHIKSLVIISKETIHTWEFVTEEAIKDAFAGKSDCALEGMTEEYGQELMGAVLKPPKASVYQLAVQFENGEYSLLELDGYYAKAFIDASAKEKAALCEPAQSREKKISCIKKVVAGCISLVSLAGLLLLL